MNTLVNLADCGELRQTLMARSPRWVRGTWLILVGLLATAIVWSALSTTDISVKATGRIRPVT